MSLFLWHLRNLKQVLSPEIQKRMVKVLFVEEKEWQEENTFHNIQKRERQIFVMDGRDKLCDLGTN